MTTSCLPGCLQWLVDAATSGVTTELGGRIGPVVAVGTSMSGGGQVIVFDGPEVTFDTSVYTQRVWIGHDPMSAAAGEVQGATSEQDFAALNRGLSRDERFEITCAASDWSGDTNMKTHRDNAYALVAQFEMFFRGTAAKPGDATMGNSCLYAQIAGPTELYMEQGPEGASATVIFRVTGRARLTT